VILPPIRDGKSLRLAGAPCGPSRNRRVCVLRDFIKFGIIRVMIDRM